MVEVVLDSIVSALVPLIFETYWEKNGKLTWTRTKTRSLSVIIIYKERNMWVWDGYETDIIKISSPSLWHLFQKFSTLFQLLLSSLPSREHWNALKRKLVNVKVFIMDSFKWLNTIKCCCNAWIKMFSQRSIPSLGIKSVIVSMLQKQLGQPSTYIGRRIPLGSSVVHPTIYSQG